MCDHQKSSESAFAALSSNTQLKSSQINFIPYCHGIQGHLASMNVNMTKRWGWLNKQGFLVSPSHRPDLCIELWYCRRPYCLADHDMSFKKVSPTFSTFDGLFCAGKTRFGWSISPTLVGVWSMSIYHCHQWPDAHLALPCGLEMFIQNSSGLMPQSRGSTRINSTTRTHWELDNKWDLTNHMAIDR